MPDGALPNPNKEGHPNQQTTTARQGARVGRNRTGGNTLTVGPVSRIGTPAPIRGRATAA